MRPKINFTGSFFELFGGCGFAPRNGDIVFRAVIFVDIDVAGVGRRRRICGGVAEDSHPVAELGELLGHIDDGFFRA